MAVIIEERGRGKFKPAPDYEINEVRELLSAKIEEERQAFADCSELIEFDKLVYDDKRWNLLSLFSGCGGLDLGFEFAGLKAVLGTDVMEAAFKDKTIFQANIQNNVFNTIYVNDIFDEARETYAKNAGRYIYIDKSDIRKIKEFPKADIVLGGFPCPGFSEGGPRLVDDKRNFLYLHFIRCLMQSRPKIFVAENVKGMMTLGKGEVFKQIVQDFAAAGYKIYHKLLNSAEYGVPQIRERVILVGVRDDVDFEYKYPKATHGYHIDGLKEVVTLRDAIGDLEENPGEYFIGSYSSIFMSRNRKKRWDEPSFTIQASGRQAPIHPSGAPMEHVGKDKYIFSDGEENNRRLSVKEIARIQTFPDWYEFSKGTKNRNENAKLDLIYKQIGNAVPVRLALAIAAPIADWVKEQLEKESKIVTKEKKVAKKKYRKLEDHIIETFRKDRLFEYQKRVYEVILAEKPSTQGSGECKTDVFVRMQEVATKEIEDIKISVKMKEKNEFQENKLTPEKIEAYFGSNWSEIVIQSAMQLKKEFENRILLYASGRYPIKPNSITVGWKLEIANKPRTLSVKVPLSEQKIRDYVYKGTNQSEYKKNAYVDGMIIDEAGVADYLLVTDIEEIQSSADVLQRMKKIDEMDVGELYFIFTANNYRTDVDKADGPRSLAVRIEWECRKNKLYPVFYYDNPLMYTGEKDMAPLVKRALQQIGKSNISEINPETDLYRKDIFES